MANLVDASAQAIADALAPSPQAPSARWRWGTVVSVSNSGTMNVSIGGATVAGIRCAQHVMGAQVGDRVRVLYCGTECMVDAIRATDSEPHIDAQEWLAALGIEVGESTVEGWGTWKWTIVNGMAIAEYENLAARSMSVTSAWGGLYSCDLGQLVFPFEFATAPQVSGSVSDAGNTTWTGFESVTSTAIGKVYVLRPTTATFNGRLCVTAIGRV